MEPRAARRFRLAPLVAAVSLVFAGKASAATIAVNDPSEGSVDGKCTLVDAVQAINGATAVNGCPAGDGVSDTIDLSFFTAATTISFDAPHSVDLESALDFAKAATIAGPLGTDGKPLVTISRSSTSGHNFRVLNTSADLTIDGVKLTGGLVAARGGGVYAGGYANLTISNSVVTGNSVTQKDYSSGGGLSSVHGNITLENSTVSNNYAAKNGGGIYCKLDGTITLTNSTVSGNNAYNAGGGIYNFNGNVTLVGSTISGNSAGIIYHGTNGNYPRGGFAGGGIYVYRVLRITNSTLTNNSTVINGGAIYAAAPFYGRPAHARPRPSLPDTGPTSGLVYMYFSTVANNSVNTQYGGSVGGMQANGYLHMVASILSNNVSGNVFAAHGTPTGFVGNNNLIFGDQPTNAPGDTLTTCDPMLASLGDYGGPTQTLPLLDGSCAIDAGPETLPNGITTDQRGLPRPVGAKSDIGAVEKQGPDDPPDKIFASGFEDIGS